MEHHTLKILGVLGLIASGGLAIFLVLTQSTRLFNWVGDNNGNPTGQTIVIPSNLFKTNKITVVVSEYFQYSNQDHETGTFNLTRLGTGETYTFSYDVEPGVFVGYEDDGSILELPAGTYNITADNHHHDLSSCNMVNWQIIQGGYLRFSGIVSGGIPEGTEGWMYVLLGLGAVILGLASVVGIIKGSKEGGNYSPSKSKPISLAGHQIKSFVESSPNYHPSTSAPSTPEPLHVAPPASSQPAPTVTSISSAELELIAQAATKKTGAQPKISSGEGLTKTCDACGKVLPANAKFCNACGHHF